MPRPLTLELLGALVGFDTTSRNSNLPLIAHVEDFLAGYGVASERVTDETGTKAGLIATIGPPAAAGYVLSGHTDTVPVDGQHWSVDPFQLTAEGDRLLGRGTCDMKGFGACVLAMVPEMAARRLARPIHIVLSYDEEVGCLGVRPLIARMNEMPVTPLGCIVGEPTGMEVVVGHKAKRSVRVRVGGLAGHSSLAPRCVNAVEHAARLIAHLGDLGRAKAGRGERDEAYDVPFTTAHVGNCHGGGALNIVPDDCVFDFELRAIAADNIDDLVAAIEAHAREVLEPAMKAVDPGSGFTFSPISAIPGLSTSPEAEIARLALALAGTQHTSKVAFGTEAGLFAASGRVPSVVCGPGSIAQAHKPDEFVTLAQLDACETFIARLIDHCTA